MLTCSCSPLTLSINPSFSEACKTIHFSLQECKTKNRFCSADLVFFVASDTCFHHIYNQTAQNIFPIFTNWKDSLFQPALCIIKINTIQQALNILSLYFRFLRLLKNKFFKEKTEKKSVKIECFIFYNQGKNCIILVDKMKLRMKYVYSV